MVDTLNILSRYYINTLYASSARNFGTNPSNPEDTTTVLEDKFITKDMSYKLDVGTSMDFSQMTNEMRSSPQKAIWVSGRLAAYSDGDHSLGVPAYYYFYGKRLTSDGSGKTYGAWLVLHYENGSVVEGTNSTNGVRPIVKLNYNIKLEKTINSNGDIVWKIL